MQGGVTSGVVYPTAICELSRRFRFRRVGGASAGAISAALLAAAEMQRQDLRTAGDPNPNQPFGNLNALGVRLAAPLNAGDPDGQRVLEGLFEPDNATAPLFAVMRGALKAGVPGALLPLAGWLAQQPGARQARQALRASGLLAPLSGWTDRQPWREEARALLGAGQLEPAWTSLVRHPWLAGAAVLAGTALLAWTVFAVARTGLGWTLQWAVVLAAWLPLLVLGGLAALLVRRAVTSLGQAAAGLLEAAQTGTREAHRSLIDNHFGLATGFGGGEAHRLTPWLHRELQRLSGAPGVLTFGSLRARQVELKLVSTCLTRQRPYVLPLDQRSDDHKDFYFRPDEWQRFFPADVLGYMMEHAERMYMDPGLPAPPARLGWSYYRLPPEEHLPVLVATRLSMSFPGLFSAVPLHFL